MANEIQYRGTETGVTLYATIRNAAGLQWRTATTAFEAVTAANWADYDVALAESSGNYFYTGTFPAITGNMVVGWYWVDIYKRATGSVLITDVLQGTIVGYWNGTSLMPWSSDVETVNSIAADPAATVDANVVSATAAAVEDLSSTTALTESYAAAGDEATLSQLLYMIMALLTEKVVIGTELTANRINGSTAAATFTLNSATAPTNITRAT